MLKALATGLILLALLASPAAAQNLERGLAAYERGDYKTAFTELLPLARRGNPTAQSALGVIYQHGLGVEADLARAIDWYGKAARGGDPLAQRLLGDLHAGGAAGAPDYAAAAQWYEAAANGGDDEARRKLGVLYLEGRGVPRDPQKAARLLDRAGSRAEAQPRSEPQTAGLATRSAQPGARKGPGGRLTRRPSSCMSGMADAPFNVEVKVEFPEVNLDHTRSIAELGKISGSGHQRRILGLMKPDFRLRSLPRSEGMTSGGRFCFWISGFEVVLRYSQIDVYVAREYAEGSCPYDAILAHEMEHVSVARANAEAFAPKIREALEGGSVPTAQTPIIVASAADAARDVQEITRENLQPVFRSMLIAQHAAQAIVDSPASRARVFAKCTDW